MKKIITASITLALALVLTGCDLEEEGHEWGASNPRTSEAEKPKAKQPKKVADSVAKEEEAPKPTKPTPSYTKAQENAIRSAQSYVDLMPFSRAGLIDQLSSEYGEGFNRADAEFAVDHIDVDWFAEAVESAESYLETMPMSRQGLIDQLTSEYGEQFTLKQATQAANAVGY